KFLGSAKYGSKFQLHWTTKWLFIVAVANKTTFFNCTHCHQELSCSHQGEKDVTHHLESAVHRENSRVISQQQRIAFLPVLDPLTDQVTHTEVKVTALFAVHNIPLATADHLGPLLKDIFPDSQIAKHLDGSNDRCLEKMNPLTVRIFDLQRHIVTTQLLDLCLTTGIHAATVEGIFSKIDEKMTSREIPWQNCVGFSVDNTSVNLGKNNSINIRVQGKNKSAYFMGCPCHIIHNTASTRGSEFSKVSGLDVEDFCIDLTSFCRDGVLSAFVKKLLGKFIQVQIIKNDVSLQDVDFANPDNQLPDESLCVGLVTKQTVYRLTNEGDISPATKKKFFSAVRAFYSSVTKYAFKKLPLNNEELKNATFVSFDVKEDCTFEQVEYFVDRYKHLFSLNPAEMEMLQDEFVDYQLLHRSEIPHYVWVEATLQTDTNDTVTCYRMDTVWAHLSNVKSPAGHMRFPSLLRLARLVLVLLHSNADEKRLFSLIRKNRTPFRPNLGLDGTLSSIIQVKLANPEPCFKFESTKEVIKKAKGATWEYNKKHR
uniref:HAT C-terminal dimerisation domain-containing protein n=1 Tax=Latimeria chalumnae TaxID=7897 RepID=H3A161_LATCH